MTRIVNLADMTMEADSPQHQPTELHNERGIRLALVAINVFIIITGMVLAVLGFEVDHYMSSVQVNVDQPPLAWTGVPPIIVGGCGIVAAASKKKKLVFTWIVSSAFLGVGGYTALTLIGGLDPHRFGITIQIYGNCEQTHAHCLCRWEDGQVTVLRFSSCTHIRHLTTLYLSAVGVLVFCIVSGVVGTILGCVFTMCLPICQIELDKRSKRQHRQPQEKSPRAAQRKRSKHTLNPAKTQVQESDANFNNSMVLRSPFHQAMRGSDSDSDFKGPVFPEDPNEPIILV